MEFFKVEDDGAPPARLSSMPATPPDMADQPDLSGGRRICSFCERPARVCLCNSLPSAPLKTQTEILIIHHPHEHRHKLATVPVLRKCILSCETLIGRRLRQGSCPLLDSLHAASLRNPHQSPRAVYLFPSTPTSHATPIDQFNFSTNVVLILFDGTWKYAREMVSASEAFLSKFAARVCLGCDRGIEGGTIYDSELLLRKELFHGCMTTMEAVARALRAMEPNGVEIERRLVEVLKAMVKFQSCHLKPVNRRPKMTKKGNIPSDVPGSS